MERELRQRLKQAFKAFCDKVEQLNKSIEFDTPFRELGFFGAPFRSNVFLVPTSSCLVSLSEWVLFLSQIIPPSTELLFISLLLFAFILIFLRGPENQYFIILLSLLESITCKSPDGILDGISN